MDEADDLEAPDSQHGCYDIDHKIADAQRDPAHPIHKLVQAYDEVAAAFHGEDDLDVRAWISGEVPDSYGKYIWQYAPAHPRSIRRRPRPRRGRSSREPGTIRRRARASGYRGPPTGCERPASPGPTGSKSGSEPAPPPNRAKRGHHDTLAQPPLPMTGEGWGESEASCRRSRDDGNPSPVGCVRITHGRSPPPLTSRIGGGFGASQSV